MNDRPVRPPVTLTRRILYGIGVLLGLTFLATFFLVYIYFLNYTVPTSGMAGTVMAGDRILARRVSFKTGNPPPRGTVIAFEYPGDRDEAKPAARQVYLSRCIAAAGDTLAIRDGRVYINGEEETPTAYMQWRFSPRYDAAYDRLRTFPRGMNYTRENWGPMRIPRRGDRIPITFETPRVWGVFIEREGHTVGQEGLRVLIDGQVAQSYVVERDYVFGIGDNRNDSQDSRYWGFIPVENIVGIPFLVYFSQSPESGDIRRDRVFADIR